MATFAALVAFGVIASQTYAGDAMLIWDASPDSSVVGYRAYFGTTSGNYDHQLDVGNQTTVTISGLNESTEYYFVVTALNANGVESDPTDEVAYAPDGSGSIVPVPLPQLDPLLQGVLETVDQTNISGWAWFPDQPDTALTIDVYIDGSYYDTTVANVFRDDLMQAGIGNGQHGFRMATPSAIQDGLTHSVATVVGALSVNLSRSVGSGAPPPVGPPDRNSLVNVSVRGDVQGGDQVMIGGFIVTGNVPKRMVLRGIGPSLANAGVSNALADPVLELYDAGGNLIARNDNWRSDPQNAALDPAFLPADERESVISIVLSAGLYSAVLHGADGASGVSLFELYDLDPSQGRTANLSSRGEVGNGDSAVIAGVIIGGDQPTTIMLRAIGPSLASSGVADALTDPFLQLYDQNGSLVLQNDNWRSDQEDAITASGIAPTDDRESAIIATLPPGSYSAVVTGSGGTTGSAVAEIYNLTSP